MNSLLSVTFIYHFNRGAYEAVILAATETTRPAGLGTLRAVAMSVAVGHRLLR